jgi:hypothetical protein
MSDEEVQAFLKRSPTGVLTTLGADGWPHSVAMWFIPVFTGGKRQVAMWSYAKSQKSVNVTRDPRAAFLVEEGVAYGELRGVLLRTRAHVITGFEGVAGIGRSLHDRYVTGRTGRAPNDASLVEIERQAKKRIGIVLRLDRVASWDHSKLGSGY